MGNRLRLSGVKEGMVWCNGNVGAHCSGGNLLYLDSIIQGLQDVTMKGNWVKGVRVSALSLYSCM